MKTKNKQTEKTNSSVPVIVLAIVIILALGGSVFLGIKGMGFGGKVKSQVSQDEVDKARAKLRANAEGEKDIYATAFKDDVTWSPGSDPATSENKNAEDGATANAAAGEYIFPNSDKAYLTDADVSSLSKENLRLARNEILARHGRIFNSADLKTYFESKSWYSGSVAPEEFDANMESRLNDAERANIEMIKKYE